MLVSDAGPMEFMILTGTVDVLPCLFGRVAVPTAVRDELTRPETPAAVRGFMSAPPSWFEVMEPKKVELIPALGGGGRRGAGEKEAIALADEIKPTALFLDDDKALKQAHLRGIPTVRVLALLDQAAEEGLIHNLPRVLNDLENKTDFHVGKIANKIMNDMKQRDIERKQEQELKAFNQEVRDLCDKIWRPEPEVGRDREAAPEAKKEPEAKSSRKPDHDRGHEW